MPNINSLQPHEIIIIQNATNLLRNALQIGNHSEIINQCSILLWYYPTSVDYLIYRSEAFYNIGNIDNAIKDADSALQFEQYPHRALEIRGMSSFQKGDYNQAITDLSRVFYEAETTYIIANILGQAYWFTENTEQSLYFTSKALEKNENDLISRTYRARALIILENYDEAKKEYNKIIASNPEDKSLISESHLNIGYILASTNCYEDALSHLDKVLESDPSNFKARAYAAECYYQLGDFEKSLVHLKFSLNCPDNQNIALIQPKIESCLREIQGYPETSGKFIYKHTRSGSGISVEGHHYLSYDKPIIGGAVVRFFKNPENRREFVVKKPHNYHENVYRTSFLEEFEVWNLVYPEYPAMWFELGNGDFRLVLPKFPGVTLNDFNVPMTTLENLRLHLAIADALRSKVHQIGYVHMDVNEHNILVRKTGNMNFDVRILDFSLTKKINTSILQFLFKNKKSSHHLPPELFPESATAEKKMFISHPSIDVYSFCRLILRHARSILELSEELIELLTKGRSNNPAERPTLENIIGSIRKNIANLSETEALESAPAALSM